MPDPQQHARRLVATLVGDVRTGLADDPFETLRELGYQIRFRPDQGGDGCSVAGSYSPGPPPTITVVEATSTGREHFTALHEFGHALIADDAADDSIHNTFATLQDGGESFEESVCDAVAGMLLIPDERVKALLGTSEPSARHVADLIDRIPTASREACCVRAAQQLRSPGYVMLAREDVAVFTAVHGTPYRVRRNTGQGADHPIAKAAGGSFRGDASVTFGSGASSPVMAVDAAAIDDRYVVAVFVDGRPPWHEGVYLPPTDRFANAVSEAYCDRCEQDFTTVAGPCPDCDGYVHPERDGGCGRCTCEGPGRPQLCTECFLRQPPAMFTHSQSVCDDHFDD